MLSQVDLGLLLTQSNSAISQALRRVQLCHDQGLTIDDTSLTTGMSVRLIKEYLTLITEFGLPNLNEPTTNTSKKSKPKSTPNKQCSKKVAK